MSRPTYTRKIMAGAIFAGGRVSSFHLTSLARHSVHRLLLRRWLEGLDSLRWLQVGLSSDEPLRRHAQRLSSFFRSARGIGRAINITRLRPRASLFAPLRDKATPRGTSIDPGSPGHRHLKHNTAGPALGEAAYVGATNGNGAGGATRRRGRTNRFAGWGGYFRADQAAREALSAILTPSTAAGGADGERCTGWLTAMAAATRASSIRCNSSNSRSS